MHVQTIKHNLKTGTDILFPPLIISVWKNGSGLSPEALPARLEFHSEDATDIR